MEVITSLENKHIKELSKLLIKKYRDSSFYFLVEGEHLVEEAFQNNALVEVLQCEENQKNYPVKTTFVSYEVLKKLSSTITPQRMIGVCKKLAEKEIGNKVLLLDGIQDPGNLGTIIRSSVAFGIDTIILSQDTVDLYNDKVIRATEGFLFKQSILRKDSKEILPLLKEKKYSIFGTKVDGGNSIKSVTYPDKFVLVMGNEGNGISKNVLALCDTYLYIPMQKEVESLNVGVATSIILYEMERNKGK